MTDLEKKLRQAAPRPCYRCGCERVLLRRTVSRSGVSMFFWMCAEERRHAREYNKWIGHEVIERWIEKGHFDSPEAIPIHSEYASTTLCAVCDKPGAEYHHWAPKSLAKFFGDDWYKWPGDYLCKAHHDLWHEVVTPYLHGRRSSENSKAVAKWLKKNGVAQ